LHSGSKPGEKPKVKPVEAEPEAKSSASQQLPQNIRVNDRPTIRLSTVTQGCLFATTVIGSHHCDMLVDTGSVVTIVSQRIYEDLGRDRPQLHRIETLLTAADGRPLELLGKATFEFRVENHVFVQEAIVVNLNDADGILGMDFLVKNKMDFKIGKAILQMPRGKIQLHMKKSYGCSRVRISDSVAIPPASEQYIKGYIEGISGNMVMVEPYRSVNRRGLLMAKAVVEPDGSDVILSVMNISDKPIRLGKNTYIGCLQPIESVHAVENMTPKQLSATHQTGTKVPEHLTPLFESASETLDTKQQDSLRSLLTEFTDVFMEPGGTLGRTDIAEHTINTGDSKPIKMHPRRTLIKQKEVIDEEVTQMLANDIIEPSNSPWASPVLLVTKKDGSIRFCVDFRKVNECTVKDAYPLPRIDETLDTLAGAQWFHTLDLASGYWQCKMSEKDKPKTAFTTHRGLFQFKVMPFGLCNAPATFERLMELVLNGLQFEKCLCYLDDIVIFGTSFESALDNLRAVLSRLREANLKLKPKKCALFQKKVLYLGHVVSDKGIQCDPSKVKAIQKWPLPTNVTEVRSFLGLAGYYRRFIPTFSSIAAPLTDLTRKNVHFVWDLRCQEAFDKLKELLVTAPILSYPTSDGRFILDTDASLFGIGAVLSQVQNGEETVIAYASKTLSKAQRNYCTTNRELLAVVTFVKHFRHYLWGRNFLVRTDHASLTWLTNFKEPEGMIARWLSVLNTYDFQLSYRKGSLHGNADGLSRRPPRKCKRRDCPDCNNNSINLVSVIGGQQARDRGCKQPRNTVDCAANTACNPASTAAVDASNWVDGWGSDQLRQWQEEDRPIGLILKLKKESDQKPPRTRLEGAPTEAKALHGMWESLCVRNGLLYRKLEPLCNRPAKEQLVAPQTIRQTVLRQLHDSRTAGHMGRERTLKLVKDRFFWPGVTTDIRRWCRKCDVCARRKHGVGRGKSPMKTSEVSAPLERIAIDIAGPFPTTANGNVCMIVVGDYFTKWMEVYAVPDHTALTVADKLMTEFISRLGTPKLIHTDQGREFESILFSTLCQKLEIQKTRTTPYRPQSDGMVERFNRTVQNMLSMFVNENRADWDDLLPYIMMAYQATVHESTGFSPNQMMFGREIFCPLDLMVGLPPEYRETICVVEYVEWLRRAIRKIFQCASEHLAIASSRQMNYQD
jgi:transposase InsO family protein